MRVFSVWPLTEYERVPFEADHEESVLEEWLESNPDGVLEDGTLLIIGRQIPTDREAGTLRVGIFSAGRPESFLRTAPR